MVAGLAIAIVRTGIRQGINRMHAKERAERKARRG